MSPDTGRDPPAPSSDKGKNSDQTIYSYLPPFVGAAPSEPVTETEQTDKEGWLCAGD